MKKERKNIKEEIFKGTKRQKKIHRERERNANRDIISDKQRLWRQNNDWTGPTGP